MAVEEPTTVATPVVAAEVNKDSGLDGKIIRQVEYYFGDLNLSKDKFMQEEIQKDEGWISLETLTKFNRLKQLSADHGVIATALKKSTNDLLEVDEENKRVRRAKPLPENPTEFETSLKANTVYAKGFPESMSLDDLIAFFETHGKVLQVYMRRIPLTKAFKGSVFCTFATKEESEKFMAAEEVKYEETVLERETQEAYLTRKAPAMARQKEEREKREADKEAKKKEREEAEAAFFQSQKVSGSVLHLKGLPAEGTRENLKELFDNFAKVKWVDYSKGEPEAYLRFIEVDKAAPALEEAKKSKENYTHELNLTSAAHNIHNTDLNSDGKQNFDLIESILEQEKELMQQPTTAVVVNRTELNCISQSKEFDEKNEKILELEAQCESLKKYACKLENHYRIKKEKFSQGQKEAEEKLQQQQIEIRSLREENACYREKVNFAKVKFCQK